MFETVSTNPDPSQVHRITFVPFLRDGRCVLVEGTDGPELPAGEVLDGEDYLLDTVLRVPLQTAGFRYQQVRVFGLDGDHLYAWIEGAPYGGDREHAKQQLTTCSAEQAAERLVSLGRPSAAATVLAAAASYRSLTDLDLYADTAHTAERAYLRGQTPQEGSGFSGTEHDWRRARYHVTDGIQDDGTFLDVGCANGFLMESVPAWCAERGLRIEPYGIDLAAGLVQEAQRRLPQ